MNIHESAEDYLETILILKERLGLVRSIDVVHEMNFSKPSVSVAMKRLRENGYIEMDAEGYLTLLPPGEEIAQRIYTRHRLLSQFLEALGVSEENAVADACKMEHDLSEETFQCLVNHARSHGLV
jgi:Mn-dependent DtxR family transcriptional regulator